VYLKPFERIQIRHRVLCRGPLLLRRSGIMSRMAPQSPRCLPSSSQTLHAPLFYCCAAALCLMRRLSHAAAGYSSNHATCHIALHNPSSSNLLPCPSPPASTAFTRGRAEWVPPTNAPNSDTRNHLSVGDGNGQKIPLPFSLSCFLVGRKQKRECQKRKQMGHNQLVRNELMRTEICW
jgi:hypothetical protein